MEALGGRGLPLVYLGGMVGGMGGGRGTAGGEVGASLDCLVHSSRMITTKT